MSADKVVKSVSFNPALPEEARMIKAFKRRNFSGYVKKLIAADLDAKQAKKEADKIIEYVPPEDVELIKPAQYTHVAPDIPEVPEVEEVPEVKVQSASERLAELKRNASMSGPLIFRP